MPKQTTDRRRRRTPRSGRGLGQRSQAHAPAPTRTFAGRGACFTAARSRGMCWRAGGLMRCLNPRASSSRTPLHVPCLTGHTLRPLRACATGACSSHRRLFEQAPGTARKQSTRWDRGAAYDMQHDACTTCRWRGAGRRMPTGPWRRPTLNPAATARASPRGGVQRRAASIKLDDDAVRAVSIE